MAAITIRQLPDGLKHRLRLRAATHGRSMEAEAREILMTALSTPAQADLSWIECLIGVADDLGGVDLPLPERSEPRTVDL